MTDRDWTVALLCNDEDAAHRFEAAADLDGAIRVVRVDEARAAHDLVVSGSADVVVASYPADPDWVGALWRCSDVALCVSLAGADDVEAAFSATEGDDGEHGGGIYAQAVLDHEDLTPSAIRRGCLAAEYVKRLQARLRRSLAEREREAERGRVARFVIENSPVVVFRWLAQSGSPVDYVSDNVSRIFGYTADEMTAPRFFYQSIIHPDDLERSLRTIMSMREAGIDQFRLEYRILTSDGSLRWIEDTTYVERDASGRVKYHQGIVIDATQRRAAQEEYEKLSQAVEQSPGSVVIADTRGRIEYINPKFTENSGYEWSDVVGKQLIAFNAAGDSAARKQLWNAIWEGDEWRGEMKKHRRDGGYYWEHVRGSPIRDGGGKITHYLEVGEDITERKRSEATIRQMAYYDALTKLPNRTLFNDRLAHSLPRARREKRVLAVLFLDLDKFKEVNDTHGHGHGDQLLIEVAQRLKDSVREGDTVSRMGGDEFMILLPSLEQASHAGAVATKILAAFQSPFDIRGHTTRVTTSIGVATYPVDGDGAEELVKNADAAMYRAKEQGRDNFQFFTGPVQEPSIRRLALQDLLVRAVTREEFQLFYQPQLEVETGNIVGAEALLRWNHPERGVLPPAEFMALAEESGIVHVLGRWVLAEATAAAVRWSEQGFGDVRVAVNLSACEFSSQEVVPAVRAVLEQTGLRADRLEIEVSESSIMRNVALASAQLEHLADLGVRIAVSDFGSGEWSMTYVRGFPVSALKLRRGLVRELPGSRDEAALAAAILSLAETLGFDVVAQGVETKEQARFLAERGCLAVQGFGFALPLPESELVSFFGRHDPNSVDLVRGT